jgi:hypothetical protein
VGWTFEKIKESKELYLSFLGLPNVTRSQNSLVFDVTTHDRLITDGVSIIGYWGLTGKPMIVWRDSESPELNFFGSLICKFLEIVDSSNSFVSALNGRGNSTKRTLLKVLLRTTLRTW